MWRQSRVSSVAALRAMPITCDLPNPGPSAARSVTNGWCHFAPRIIVPYTGLATKSGGGRRWELSRLGTLTGFGTRPGIHFRNGKVASPPKSKEMKL